MENKIKTIGTEELKNMGFSNNEIDAMNESIFYEDRLIFESGEFLLQSKHRPDFKKDINCYDTSDIKQWIKEKTECNDAYNEALKA